MGDIALNKSLDRFSWIVVYRLPEDPIDMLRAGHKQMAGLRHMTSNKTWRPVPVNCIVTPAALKCLWRNHLAIMGIEAPDVICFPATSATGAVMPAIAQFRACWNHGLAKKRSSEGEALTPRIWLGLPDRDSSCCRQRARGHTAAASSGALSAGAARHGAAAAPSAARRAASSRASSSTSVQ